MALCGVFNDTTPGHHPVADRFADRARIALVLAGVLRWLVRRGLPPGCGVPACLPPGECLGRGPGVAREAGDARVAALGHQHRRAGTVLRIMGQRRVPQLVQGGPVGSGAEQRGGLPGPNTSAVRSGVAPSQAAPCFNAKPTNSGALLYVFAACN
jgi:hypothetical protein